jgi:hypothetical protein
VAQLEQQADADDDSVGPAPLATDPESLERGLSDIEEFLRDQNS